MGCSLAFYDRFEKLNYELETINNNLCRLSSLLEKVFIDSFVVEKFSN